MRAARALTLVVVVAIVGVPAMPAEPAAPVGTVLEVRGTATVTRVPASPRTRLTVRQTLAGNERISVGGASRVRLRLAGGAVVTLAEGSTVTVAAGDRPGLTLEAGTVVYDAPTGRLPAGQIHEIRTGNAVARLHDAQVVVEVGYSAAALTQTRLCVLGGTVSALKRWLPSVVLSVVTHECLDINGGALGQPSAGSAREINRARALAGLPAVSAPALVSPPSARLVPRDFPQPGPWVLLVDRGDGFVPWVGRPADGYVAGDATYGGMTLGSCDDLAQVVAEEGARLACARAPWETPERPARYRDTQGRVLAEGPLAGRLMVYEPSLPRTAWRLVLLGGPGISGRWTTGDSSRLGLLACHERLASASASVCARVTTGPDDYRDAEGRVLAHGPFAGGLIVRDGAP